MVHDATPADGHTHGGEGAPKRMSGAVARTLSNTPGGINRRRPEAVGEGPT
jgi:hypothetical protein